MTVLTFALLLILSCDAYLPVIMMHGFTFSNNDGNHHDFDHIVSWINKYHPGTKTLALPLFEGEASGTPMWEQIPNITAAIQAQVQKWGGGKFHIIGHSQGGLMMRSVIETTPLNVENFISMAGVQNGYYGAPKFIRDIIGDFPAEVLTYILYTTFMQNELSLANWWRTPLVSEYKFYLSDNIFFPIIDNEASMAVNASARFANFCRPSKMAFFGSPDDGTLAPWNTALFGFYSDNMSLVPAESLPIYKKDLFGLKTMMDAGRATLTRVDGIEHKQWLLNETNFVNNILPLLT